jgi:hypothetical protein
LAGVLLLLFAFSITPRKIIHDFLATHKDKTALSASSGSINVNKASYNCKCDHIVVESPFTWQDNRLAYLDFQSFLHYSDKIEHGFCSFGFFFFELRGPPFASLS